jgi:hypothetical protein
MVLGAPGPQAGVLLHRLTRDMVVAVYSQECQYRVMKSHHLHKQRIHEYCSRYCSCAGACPDLLLPSRVDITNVASAALRYLAGTDLLELCADVEFPPCLMMRRFLEHLLQLPNKVSPGQPTPAATVLSHGEGLWQWLSCANSTQPCVAAAFSSASLGTNPPTGGVCMPSDRVAASCCGAAAAGPQKVNDVLKDPSVLHQLLPDSAHSTPTDIAASCGPGRPRPGAGPLDAGLVARLAGDVVRSVVADPCYSPLSDMAKTLAGELWG